MIQPDAQTKNTLKIARAIQAFAARHEQLRVVPVYLPADIYMSADRTEDSPLSPHIQAAQIPPWTDTRLRDATIKALTGLDPNSTRRVGHSWIGGG